MYLGCFVYSYVVGVEEGVQPVARLRRCSNSSQGSSPSPSSSSSLRNSSQKRSEAVVERSLKNWPPRPDFQPRPRFLHLSPPWLAFPSPSPSAWETCCYCCCWHCSSLIRRAVNSPKWPLPYWSVFPSPSWTGRLIGSFFWKANVHCHWLKQRILTKLYLKSMELLENGSFLFRKLFRSEFLRASGNKCSCRIWLLGLLNSSIDPYELQVSAVGKILTQPPLLPFSSLAFLKKDRLSPLNTLMT